MSECVECGGPLSGRQTRFCSALCKRRAWLRDNRDRDQATSHAWKERNREANRARDRDFLRQPELRGICTVCGGLRGSGAARRGEGRCAACRHKLALAREQRIVDLYNAGVPLARMAAELDVTIGSVSRDTNRLRLQGRIGYRYAGWAAKQAA